MSDHQRIHPAAHDPESVLPTHAPTAPLVPLGSSKSDHGDPGSYPTAPVGQSKPPKSRKRRSCCCRFLCWTLSIILILVIAIGITVGILYLVFRPKLPKYSIDGLQVTQFSLASNDSLNATFDVTITARNNNKKIGIYYEGGSRITVRYNGSELARGALPKFYQGHRNTTVLVVPLTGQTDNATSLLTSLQQQQQQTGVVPLNLRVRQPVRVKLGKLKLPKFKFIVRCRLEVDSLSAGNSISIKNSSCKFRFRL